MTIRLLTTLATCLAPMAVIAQTAITPVPQSAFTALAPRIDRRAIPNLADDFKPDRKQSFAIQGPGFRPFTMVPARYESTSEEDRNATYRCGVYILPNDGPAAFIRTLGYDEREPEICSGLIAVGFITLPSAPPRIILLYDGGSFNSPGHDPVVLDWNPTTQRYASNDKIVDNLKDVSTIAAIKTQLKAKHP